MRTGIARRLGEIAKAIDSTPIPHDILKAAFERFRDTGSLPDSNTVTRAVLRQCKTGLEASEVARMDDASMIRHFLHHDRPEDPIMDGLYVEATSDNTLARDVARYALQLLHDCGFDVTQPVFAKSGDPPDPPRLGTAGLWVLGFPEVLVRPPYEEQALRLIDRYAELRERAPQGNRRWFERLAAAMRAFRDFGVVPEDELVLDCVLADLELTELMENLRGAADSELMAALDAAARAPRDASAIDRVRNLVARQAAHNDGRTFAEVATERGLAP